VTFELSFGNMRCVPAIDRLRKKLSRQGSGMKKGPETWNRRGFQKIAILKSTQAAFFY